MVLLDADDVALGAFENTVNNADLISLGELIYKLVVEVEAFDARLGDNLEDGHLAIGNGRRNTSFIAVEMLIEHDFIKELGFCFFSFCLRGVKEYQARNDGFFNHDLPSIACLFSLLHFIEILHALRGEILLDRFSFTKKDLESVPMLYAILLRHLLFLCGV